MIMRFVDFGIERYLDVRVETFALAEVFFGLENDSPRKRIVRISPSPCRGHVSTLKAPEWTSRVGLSPGRDAAV